MDGAEAVSYPPVPNEQAENCANLFFSSEVQGIRALDPEISGGRIALVATNNNEAQQPPTTLDRMHASRENRSHSTREFLKTKTKLAASTQPSRFPAGHEVGQTGLCQRWRTDAWNQTDLRPTLESRKQTNDGDE
jgi:hypothetical protein